jgi:hypothetical protein
MVRRAWTSRPSARRRRPAHGLHSARGTSILLRPMIPKDSIRQVSFQQNFNIQLQYPAPRIPSNNSMQEATHISHSFRWRVAFSADARAHNTILGTVVSGKVRILYARGQRASYLIIRTPNFHDRSTQYSRITKRAAQSLSWTHGSLRPYPRISASNFFFDFICINRAALIWRRWTFETGAKKSLYISL